MDDPEKCNFCIFLRNEGFKSLYRTDLVFVLRDAKDQYLLGHFLVIPIKHTENHDYEQTMLQHMHVVGIVVAAIQLLEQKKRGGHSEISETAFIGKRRLFF